MPEMWDIVDQNGNKTGRLHERGRPMQKGEYPLSVSVWILNRQGEFLISKRAPAKTAPGMWESPAVIKRMIREGRFTAYSYMEELLDAASAWREP